MAPFISKSIDQAAVQLTRGNRSWSDELGTPAGPITFAFRSTAAEENADSFTRFSADQITAAEEALNLWSDVANISFNRVGGTGYSNNATILFANYDEGEKSDGRSAYAVPPHPDGTAANDRTGDVWVDLSDADNANVSLGSRGFTRLIHEIGHTLGLHHPGDYNASAGVSITYDGNAEYIEDSRQYTVMSYFQAAETGADHVSGATVYGATPLLHDIAAIQRLYGANMSTRTGNDTYGFNSNTNRASFSIDNANEKVVFAVWDVGGTDTFDFSGYSQDQTIRLGAGQFSDVGRLTKNIAIAKGVTIENARGGSGNDDITGNAAANKLTGNDGNDDLRGAEGNDTLDGGDGDDTLVGWTGADQMTGGHGKDNLFGGEGNDTLDGGNDDDGLDGGAGSDTMSGGAGNDILVGGANNDTLRGDAGDDRHNGGTGADYMVGGVGNDTYYVDHVGDNVSDSVTTFTPVPGALLGLPTFNNAGTDTIYADLASYTLPSLIEELKASRANPFAGTGNALDNWLQGHFAADTLKGLAGKDTLVGLRGRDVLTGGSEADVFMYISQADSGTTASTRDRIADFQTGGDRIDLSSIDARSGSKQSLFFTGNNAFSFIDTDAFSGVAGQLHYLHTTVVRTAVTIVEGDINGDRLADFQIELTGRKTLEAGDFIL